MLKASCWSACLSSWKTVGKQSEKRPAGQEEVGRWKGNLYVLLTCHCSLLTAMCACIVLWLLSEYELFWYAVSTVCRSTPGSWPNKAGLDVSPAVLASVRAYKVAQLKWSQLTILPVTFECIGKIQWFLANVNCIQQEVVWCKFQANFVMINT